MEHAPSNFQAAGGERARVAAPRLGGSPLIEIIPQSDAQLRAAFERYAATPDQRWSLSDCASFIVMEERGVTEALAYDRDFEQAGFSALLRDDPA